MWRPMIRLYGTNTPWVANRELSAEVSASPSTPPSNRRTRSNPQTERSLSVTVPGRRVSAVVVTEQVEPRSFGVCEQG
jgi:hypothetical protein